MAGERERGAGSGDGTAPETGHEQHRSTPARGAARSLIFRVMTAGTDALIVVVTARGFGVEGRGLYALTTLAATIMVTVLGGATTALAAEVAHARSSAGQLLAGSGALAVLGGGAMALLAAAVAFVTWPRLDVLLYAAAALPFLLLVVYQLAIYIARGEVRRYHYLHLARSAVPLVALTIVALAAPGEIHVALAVWAGVEIAIGLTIARLEARRITPEWRGLRALMRRIVRRGSKVSLGNGIAQLNYRVDLLIVAALLPLADVGRYSVAIAIGEVLWLLSRAVMTGAYASIVGAESDSESARLTLRAFRHSFALLVGAGLVLLLPARLLIEPVFGDDFDGVWIALALILPGVVALGMVEVVREYFLVRLERSREYLIMASGAMVLNLALALALVPGLGLKGAALSTTISYLGAATYLLVRFGRTTGATDLRAYLPGRAELSDYRRLLGSVRPLRRAAA